MMSRRMSTNDSVAIVVYYIIIILYTTLHLWVTTLIVCPKTMSHSPVCGAIGYSTKTLRVNTLANDTVLPCYVSSIFDMHIIPTSPRNRAMVKNHLVAVVKSKRTFRTIHCDASSHTDIANDNIRATCCYYTATIKGDTLSRSSLTSDGNIGSNSKVRLCDVDNSTNIKHYDTSGLAYRFCQRPSSRVIKISYVYHGATTSTRRIRAITFSTWECQLLSMYAKAY